MLREPRRFGHAEASSSLRSPACRSPTHDPGLEARRLRATICRSRGPSRGGIHGQRLAGDTEGLSQHDALSGRRRCGPRDRVLQVGVRRDRSDAHGGPRRQVGHAEIRIGNSRIMLADEFPGHGVPQRQDATAARRSPHLYVEDVDAVAGRRSPPAPRSSGRSRTSSTAIGLGSFEDPFGHVWHVATRKEDLPPDELKRRAEQAMRQGG